MCRNFTLKSNFQMTLKVGVFVKLYIMKAKLNYVYVIRINYNSHITLPFRNNLFTIEFFNYSQIKTQ